ncbi:DNA-binding protein [Alteromonas sp. McT4-15]|uniref:DNA-binding protein n=1 Tax=Alteromonas sp. McT4-15 TaxID=2881256 RepID=UPI001CF85F54|nr:DNA-binding protein [Alteromonas sp. McT4-15]MCB4435563.1 DNA-binding protein [Alteromonas sp. McT4-15]
MARHPEIPDKAIIQAGKELEELGKTPNPGAIRAHLGYRGGLIRIKSVWNSFVQQREQKLIPETQAELTFDALPESYAENAGELMKKLNAALEQLILEAYQHSRKVFEKRMQDIEHSERLRLQEWTDAEQQADKSISRLEDEVNDLQKELTSLADQNAKLLIENAEFRGRLAILDERFASEGKVKQVGETV